MLDNSSNNKPLIITEGETDWIHMKNAYEKLMNTDKEFAEKYESLEFEFLEYCSSPNAILQIQMGDSNLYNMCDSFSRIPQGRKMIFIGDNDGNISDIYSEGIIITDKTPFYATMGGQKGDIGILNQRNAFFILNEGKIICQDCKIPTTMIYNKDSATINIEGGRIELNNLYANKNSYIIYNISSGNLNISSGEIIGINNIGTTYAIYNYIYNEEENRNINISGGNLNISGSNIDNLYGFFYEFYNNNLLMQHQKRRAIL